MTNTTQTYEPGDHPDMTPPLSEVGIIGWLRTNLFPDWINCLLTIGAIWLLFIIVPPILEWSFFNATISGDDRSYCNATIEEIAAEKGVDTSEVGGACWTFIKSRLAQFTYGFYPESERWRVDILLFLLTISILWLAIEKLPGKKWVAGLSLIGLPLLSYFFIYGGSFGLVIVETPKWGGLMLTLVISIVGIVASLPIGVLLALGRRSQMPTIRTICITFIEFWRGVPLITVLFMASVMLPLFLPEGVNFDKLMRALIGVMLFSAAYMAEVIRGGLQAIPKGQYEGAQAIGLSYWRMMGFVILPQALKLVIPGIVNSFIALFKDTTLVLIIGLYDFLGIVQAASQNTDWLGYAVEGYVFCAVVYWMFCFGMSQYSIHLEKKLHTGH